MTKLALSILCLGLVLGGMCPALDVAEKLLEDYQQQRRACGDEDELAMLRLRADFTWLKAWTALETDDEAYDLASEELLALREQAYLLAKARYEQGLASLRDVYETGAQLYYMTQCRQRVRPTLEEELRTMRMTLLRSARATGNKAEELKTAIIWYTNVELILTDINLMYGEELRDLSREQYQQGLISYWELAQTEINLLKVTSEEQYAAYVAELYKAIEANEVATSRNDYRITELLFHARARLVEHRKWENLSH